MHRIRNSNAFGEKIRTYLSSTILPLCRFYALKNDSANPRYPAISMMYEREIRCTNTVRDTFRRKRWKTWGKESRLDTIRMSGKYRSVGFFRSSNLSFENVIKVRWNASRRFVADVCNNASQLNQRVLKKFVKFVRQFSPNRNRLQKSFYESKSPHCVKEKTSNAVIYPPPFFPLFLKNIKWHDLIEYRSSLKCY